MNGTTTVSKTASPVTAPSTRASSTVLDHLRARALRGDALRELSDSRREWVWRSLLKGVRAQEALAMAGMTIDDLAPALEQVRQRYQRRLELYKQTAEQHPRVRRPIEKPTTTPSKRRIWWPFGFRGQRSRS